MKKSRTRAAPSSGESPDAVAASARDAGGGRSGGNGQTAARESDKLSPEQRYKLIAEAAYRRAEQRSFVGGDPVADWLDAEREVDDSTRAAGERSRNG